MLKLIKNLNFQFQKASEKTYVFFHGVQDERFELVEAVVDSGTALLLHDGFVTLKHTKAHVNKNVTI